MGYLSNCTDNARIGYYGVPGSNTHEAMLAIFGDNFEGIYRENFEDIFKILVDGIVKYAVLPIENSSTGGINDVMDLLYKYDAFIVGEKCLKIDNNLLGLSGATLDDIDEIYSHPQPLQQCKEFLETRRDWKLFNYYNTAKSAEFVKNSNSIHKAAIGNMSAARLYGLEVIKANINTNEHNYTRFIIISKELENDETSDKISVILNLPHICGSLYNIIKIISENCLNMMKIESRPIMGKPWEYSFYIDFQGNIRDEKIREALESIRKASTNFKLLGNFKADC